jgi:hypothetical protein
MGETVDVLVTGAMLALCETSHTEVVGQEGSLEAGSAGVAYRRWCVLCAMTQRTTTTTRGNQSHFPI